MADHAENLAQVDEGKSLLPQIVEKEHELKQRLADAEAEATASRRAAEERRDEAIAKAKESLPASEQAWLDEQLAAFQGEIEAHEKSERARLDALKAAASKNVDKAAETLVSLVLRTDD